MSTCTGVAWYNFLYYYKIPNYHCTRAHSTTITIGPRWSTRLLLVVTADVCRAEK